MANALSAQKADTIQLQKLSERAGPLQPQGQRPISVTIPTIVASSQARNSYLRIDTFSSVNQNGSFEFDRVIKSGVVLKRTRKTKAWKSIFLVLRPNSLSIYRNQKEDKLRHKIHLSDLTAVALLKDPKQKRQHIFGLFSPSRNFHLEANSRQDVQEWVDLIRQTARIEEQEEMLLASPTWNNVSMNRLSQVMQSQSKGLHGERLSSSSPEPGDLVPRTSKTEALGSTTARRPSCTVDYSGNEFASHSDWSDIEISRKRGPSSGSAQEEVFAVKDSLPPSLSGIRNQSQMSGFNVEKDLERVVWQGYLLWLKSKSGVRQWKDSWVVIRPKNITFYKNNSEYLPTLIIPVSSIVNVVEIDPISKTKKFCLQFITEEKSYRFCAHNEDDLDNSIGAIKSLLARRKESRTC
ncbi:unnamed protein product [Blumeria hordei]|uniref:PH domain-containing protein n=1 Tax=Blumeria hordei TaxID=2867405 RepID=A0A383UPY4_BLUHO|nr:unnamed protein product [Blumeria hordei]